ncbi:alpha-L-fucosidase [Portibacter lacus]|uniref:alpha-L-fucosidase n=1 Tax=Portibacter lacus TaxID=1099794 RepID=UPI00374D4CD7
MKLNNFLSLLILIALCFHVTAQDNTPEIPRPTKEQMMWQDAELGVVFHYDLHVFDNEVYNQAHNRISPILDINMFNPEGLDTDQWVKSAKDAGAKFAILTATHETGFALYQSDINPYSMKALKFQDGKGDIVRDFVESCRKYGLLPGIYIGIRWNSFFGVYDFKVSGDNEFSKNRQLAYKKMCEGMVKELCTKYGDLFMIWFDGGADDPNNYGADVLPIVQKFQPKCLFYHNSQLAAFRWGGSESGTVPYPCWATFPYPFSHSANQKIVYGNNFELLKHGDKDGKYWMPAMSDAPLRGYKGHDWFWEPESEHKIYPLDNLVQMYLKSAGRNSTLILGLTPDPRGLMPDADVARLKELGDFKKKHFSNPIATTQGNRKEVILNLDKETLVNTIIIREEISQGERVRAYTLSGYNNGSWSEISNGSNIGNKRIEVIESQQFSKVKLTITEATKPPMIKEFSAFHIEDLAIK